MDLVERQWTNRTIKVLSLGAGVQSTTLLLLSIHGILPKLDYAIFADTGWESEDVYNHLTWLEEKSAEVGIKVLRVDNGDLRQDVIDGVVNETKTFSGLPLYLKRTGPEEKKTGMGKRQCTSTYKIQPIEDSLRSVILGLKPHSKAPKHICIEQWIGISADEAHRAKPSPHRWKVHSFPFLGIESEYFEVPWSREDCISWLQEQYPDKYIPRSSCLGCPFHSNSEWLRIKASPAEWADVVEFDKLIRRSGWGDESTTEQYLHSSLKPLDEVKFEEEKDVDRWGNECEGMCGV